MELLFDNKKTIHTKVPATFTQGSDCHAATIRDLIGWMAVHLLKERPELFMGPDSSV